MAVALEKMEINSQPDVKKPENPITGVIKTNNVDLGSKLVVYENGMMEFIPYYEVPEEFLSQKICGSGRFKCLGNMEHR